jgi:hypothetical protein
MADLNKRNSDIPAPPTGGADSNNKPPKNFLTYVMIFFVVPIMAAWETYKGLHSRVYEKGFGGPLRLALGILTGLAAGIGAGYYGATEYGWTWFAWLPAGIGTTIATYAYLWPLAYLVLLKPFYTVSKELWDAVPTKDQWFTNFLKFASRIGVLAGSGFVAYTQGAAALANLQGSGWGPFAYVGAFAWFAIVGLILASFAWSIFTTTIAGICAGTGLLLSYALLPTTHSLLSGYGFTAMSWTYAAAAVEFAVYCAFVFPLLHVLASHGLRFVKDLAQKAYTAAYVTKVGVYEGVFTQLVNIWTAYHLASLTIVFASALGFALTGWALWVVPAAVALLSYLLVGQIFRAVGNKGLGVVAAAHGLRWGILLLAGYGLGWGWIAAGAAVAAALTFYVAYPVAYVLVRMVGQYLLNNSVANVLVTAHDKAVDAAENLLTEVARARKNTYGDESWFSHLFSHLANIAALLPVWYYTNGFLGSVGTTGWLAYAFTGLALVLSYLLLGRLLKAAQNVLIGGALTLAGAVATGILTYGATSYGLWVAVPAGLFGGFLVAGWLFPISYVLTRFIVNLVDGFVPLFSKVLEPVVRNVHEFCWTQVSGLWTQFKATYRMVKDAVKPAWESVNKAWSEAWQSVKDTWDSIKGSRK